MPCLLRGVAWETTWTVLRKFGYDDEIMLRKDLFQNPSFKRNPDSSVELTEKAIEFLKKMFTTFDEDKDSALRPQEVEELVCTAPSRSIAYPHTANLCESIDNRHFFF
ncbi:hypothetical protein M758_2G056900 [Ceratodon purpureus]|nr:hypothetical protein M758_2G056900 [Ceratodon purpureus]